MTTVFTIALVLPGLPFSWLAKRKGQFIPDEAKRKLCVCGLTAGSIIGEMLIR